MLSGDRVEDKRGKLFDSVELSEAYRKGFNQGTIWGINYAIDFLKGQVKTLQDVYSQIDNRVAVEGVANISEE